MMMKKTQILAITQTLAITAVCFVGCSHSKPRQENAQPAAAQQEAPPKELGQEVSKAGETTIPQSREVTRTISSDVPTVKVIEYRGDLNRMNATQFEVLGFAPDVAQNIVNFRSQHGGRFNQVDELKQVPGMNESLFNQMRTKLGVSP